MEKYIDLKTTIEVRRQEKACKLAAETLVLIKDYIKPGISTEDLEKICVKYIQKRGGEAALKGFNGFPSSICISVNSVAAHGIPGEYKLRNGDILTIDITVCLDGWYGDCAWTYYVGLKIDRNIKRLIDGAYAACLAGINSAKAASRIGDVGFAIESVAKSYGLKVLKELVGHGVGRNIHEEPQIPSYGEKGVGQAIVPGMVITIEPVLSLGDNNITRINDNQTILTSDGSLTAQFEHTIAVFSNKTEILTKS